MNKAIPEEKSQTHPILLSWKRTPRSATSVVNENYVSLDWLLWHFRGHNLYGKLEKAVGRWYKPRFVLASLTDSQLSWLSKTLSANELLKSFKVIKK